MQVGGAAAATNQLNLNARVLLEPKTRDALGTAHNRMSVRARFFVTPSGQPLPVLIAKPKSTPRSSAKTAKKD